MSIMRAGWSAGGRGAASQRGDPSVLDHYGASDPGEFFAVATEAFFEAPAAMQAEHPGLYAQLRDYFQVDPAAWRAAAESRGGR